MKHLLVLCALLAVGSCAWKGGFRIRFDMGLFGIGSSFFYEVPQTRTQAASQGWIQRQPPPGLPVTSVDLYCYSDQIVCIFYDFYGIVAGMQIALPETDLSDVQYDLEENGFTQWIVNIANTERTYWTIQQYYTTEETLRSGVVRADKIIENGGVWVTGVRKELRLIQNTTNAISNDGIFTRQGCFPRMGRHYYYRMNEQTSCVTEPLYPWFAIVESGELVATGFMFFANLNLNSNARNWFETPDVLAVKVIVPDAPDCLYDRVPVSLITMHVYYIDQPWLITCIFQ